MTDTQAATPTEADVGVVAAIPDARPHGIARRFLYRDGASCPIDGDAPPQPDLRIEGAPQSPTVLPPPSGWYGERPFLPALDPTPLPDVIAAAAADLMDEMMARLQGGGGWEGHRLIRETRAARYASLGSKDELAAVSADTT